MVILPRHDAPQERAAGRPPYGIGEGVVTG